MSHVPFSNKRDLPKPSKRLEGKPLVTYVLAGTRAEFERWVATYDDPYTAANAVYLARASVLVGKKDYLILKYGTWRERTDLKKIESQHRANVGDLGKFETFEAHSRHSW